MEIARQGTDEDLFERLFDYIHNLNTDWIDEIKGISNEEIQQLENLFKMVDKNFKLPKSFYIYLKDMSINNGKIDFCSNINKLFNYNKIYIYNLHANNIKTIEYIIIDIMSNGNIITLIDLFNNEKIVNSCIEKKYKDFINKKINFEDFKNKQIKENFINKKYLFNISDSLEQLLFSKAFEAYEKDRNYSKLLEICNWYYNIKNYDEIKYIREMVENIFKKYNINKTWFSVIDSYYGYREDLVICINFDDYDYDDESILIYGFIKGENIELMENICKEIEIYKLNNNKYR